MDIKIQSISDIITNSSTEVFVISTNKHAEVAKFIKDICDVFGVDMNEIMEFESITADQKGWDNLKYKKGDLVIESADDNSIPLPIMDMIETLRWANTPNVKNLNIRNIIRRHLG